MNLQESQPLTDIEKLMVKIEYHFILLGYHGRADYLDNQMDFLWENYNLGKFDYEKIRIFSFDLRCEMQENYVRQEPWQVIKRTSVNLQQIEYTNIILQYGYPLIMMN